MDQIEKALQYLRLSQKKDGSFRSLSSTNPHDFSQAIEHESLFPTVFIANAVPELTPEKFLLSQKSDYWSWNYWIRNSPEANQTPYPDDLDDTSLALAALHTLNPRLCDGEVMARIVELLTTLEVKEGGPYRTWLVPETAPQGFLDVDLAVNANISFILSQFDIVLPPLAKFIDKAIRQCMFTSPYYYGEYPLLYFLSRGYTGKHKKILETYIHKKQPKDVLSTALLVSTGLISSPSYTDFLLSQQRDDGSWEASALVIEQKKEGITWYAGSREITTAVCVEALRKTQRVKGAKSQRDMGQDIAKQVITSVIKRFKCLEEPLMKTAIKSLKRIEKIDTHQQIILLPYLFARAVDFFDEELLIQLGCANVYGWIAYTIYDDFLDGEGKPEDLSVANMCLREMTKTFEVSTSEVEKLHIGGGGKGNSGFREFYSLIIDKIDTANTWEVMNRNGIPDYGDLSQLAHKSLGHGLGPLAILFALGYDQKSKEIQSLLAFFHHYLIARQLNDDAHDWEEDMKKGQINAVGVMVLKRMKTRRLKDDETRRREIFWETIIIEVCTLVTAHTQQARKALKQLSVIKHDEVLETILKSLDQAVETALTERKKTQDFLLHYER